MQKNIFFLFFHLDFIGCHIKSKLWKNWHLSWFHFLYHRNFAIFTGVQTYFIYCIKANSYWWWVFCFVFFVFQLWKWLVARVYIQHVCGLDCRYIYKMQTLSLLCFFQWMYICKNFFRITFCGPNLSLCKKRQATPRDYFPQLWNNHCLCCDVRKLKSWAMTSHWWLGFASAFARLSHVCLPASSSVSSTACTHIFASSHPNTSTAGAWKMTGMRSRPLPRTSVRQMIRFTSLMVA